MSYMAIITFDIENPPNNIYKKITERLEDLAFYKSRHGKRSVEFDLPNNTYIAEFDGDDHESSKELVNFLKIEIEDIFKELKIKGKYFVFSGQKWAWAGKTPKPKLVLRRKLM